MLEKPGLYLFHIKLCINDQLDLEKIAFFCGQILCQFSGFSCMILLLLLHLRYIL